MTDWICGPLDALKNAVDSLQFWGNNNPLCPHCGHECEVGRNEWYRLYEEGLHDVECPKCERPFVVVTRVSYSFSTDKQGQP